ncbi:uncharacterized protein LOC110229051 [Arabidopsis lyrata subsp. lyrata]|uniref:uncharacterized protein LOC110229051 n=1 Tax=Arabidopsis lyrata subsp. lyrata TaxID=81972 RepID=UPI000A29D6DC|nr:uncharacterized protein LOC110229051 [Arabidopsis lyrata subsp. lyrata]|eukprot:XP_020883504.1 uncharacterized protein LOC110229051 [Arabidopsis lyrata subsp. lyrata]
MDEIRRLNPKLSKYLEDADIRLWSTAHFQGNRYNITTTNTAESINGLLKDAREYPIVAFLDHVRATLTRWFCERREKAAKLVTELGPYAAREIEKIREEANTLAVQPINLNQFHVTGGSQDAVVDIQKLSCSCRAFDIKKIPCMHAIAVATKKQIPEHTLSDPCYTRAFLFAAYSESIYPVQGILNDIQIPSEVEKSQCLPPQGRRRSGRPKKKRIQSSLEIAMENKRPRKEHKCSRCKLPGHNKKTCETALP